MPGVRRFWVVSRKKQAVRKNTLWLIEVNLCDGDKWITWLFVCEALIGDYLES